MKQSNKLILGVVVLIIIVGVFLALKAHKGVPGGPTGAVPGPPPAGAMGAQGDNAQSEAFEKSHRYVMQLVKLLGNIGRLEEDNKAAFTPAQAKSALAVLEPLRKQKVLEEDAAKKAVNSLRAILTSNQLAAISSMPPENQFRKGGAPPAGPMPGGPMPEGARPSGKLPSGPPPSMGPKPIKDFNPLNPPAGGPGGKQGSNPTDKLFEDLRNKVVSE